MLGRGDVVFPMMDPIGDGQGVFVFFDKGGVIKESLSHLFGHLFSHTVTYFPDSWGEVAAKS